MKKLALIVVLILIGMYLNAQEENCAQISQGWNSEEDAIEQVQNTIFKTHETILPKDSWVKIAHFYSCDDEYGFVIVQSTDTTFIHQNVPKTVWAALKEARSVSGFYNFYIKNIYKSEIKNTNTPEL
ncbi:MAG: KTSC domain-containing protein [Cytophagales bacterium]|nr:KTSC domain-containing protein [Cytophagales bacterium]